MAQNKQPLAAQGGGVASRTHHLQDHETGEACMVVTTKG